MKRCCDLHGVGHTEVDGRTVGVVGLRQAVDEVATLGLSDEAQITEELLQRVERANYVPAKERPAYGAALLAHHRQLQPTRIADTEEVTMKKIEVLGTGCPKCQMTAKNAEEAVRDLGIEAEIVKVEDLEAIMAHGVMMTPALAIDGQLVISGHVATVNEIKQHLQGG